MPPQIHRGAAPFLVVVFAILVLSIMDGTVKALGATVPLGQIVVLRYVFGALVALPFFLLARPRLTRASFMANALRAVTVVVTATCFFHAIDTLPLAEALALSHCAPLFIALFGALLLGERVTREVVASIGLGFTGVLVILWARFGQGVALDPRALSGVAAALASAVTYGLTLVLLRRQSAHDPVPVLVFLQGACAAVLALPGLAFGMVELDALHLGGLALVGLLGTIGHFALAWGYARAEAARLGPIDYTAFLWASLIGYVIYREPLQPSTVAGAALIIVACLLASRRREVAVDAERAGAGAGG